MQPVLYIIDDFFDNFDEIRSMALNAEYPEKDLTQEEINEIAEYYGYPDRIGPAYQGRNSKHGYYIPGAFERLSKILKSPLWWQEDISTGHFRRGFKNDPMKQYIHADNVDFAGIVFLNTPEQCSKNSHCGTSLWRHKRTNTEYVDIKKWTPQEITSVIYDEGMSLDLWEKTFDIPIKSNRLVLFNAKYWHSHSSNFGSTIEDCRLTYLMLVNIGIKPISIS